MPLVDHPTGNYRFLPGIAPYSCGVVSSPSFEIVHVTLRRPVAYREGFEALARYLDAQGRPKAARCGGTTATAAATSGTRLTRSPLRSTPRPAACAPRETSDP